jgi:hypothetical protein
VIKSWCLRLSWIIPGAWHGMAWPILLPYVARRLSRAQSHLQDEIRAPQQAEWLPVPGSSMASSRLLETHPRCIIGQFSCARHTSL